jgi:hypothetical protein
VTVARSILTWEDKREKVIKTLEQQEEYRQKHFMFMTIKRPILKQIRANAIRDVMADKRMKKRIKMFLEIFPLTRAFK